MNKASEMQAVVEMTRSIPCAPAILPKLLKLTEGSAADIGELETLITMDTGLATSVLRTANSAYFGNASRCDNIADAVLRLGSKTLYRIAANTLTGRWLVHPLRGYGWEPGDLCRHSLCVAICAEVFAGMTNLADTSTAYTAGLIHDLGKFALAYANLSALDDVASRVPNEYATWREAETAILGGDPSDLRDFLDVDDQLRLDQIHLHLNDDVRSARQNAAQSRRAGQQRNGCAQAFGRFISEVCHVSPCPL